MERGESLMKKHLYTLTALMMMASMVLAACGGATATSTAAETATVSTPTTAAPADNGDRVKIRWFVGLGTGTNPEQIAVQDEVVADFNSSQDKIELEIEVVPYNAAYDNLATQIASGA